MSWVLEDGPCSRGKHEKLEVAELIDELWFFHNMLATRTAPFKPTPDSSPNTGKRSIARAKRERTTPPKTSTFLPKLQHSSPSANLLRKLCLLSLPPPTSKERSAQENGITRQQICGKLRRRFNTCPCTKLSLTHPAISHSSPYSKVDEMGSRRIEIPKPRGRLQRANSRFKDEGEKKKSRLQQVNSCFEGEGKKREEKKSRLQQVYSCFKSGGEKREEKKSRLRRANSSFEVEGENREERTRLRWKKGYKGVNIQGPNQFPLSRIEFEGEKRDGKKRRLQQANSCFQGEGKKREEKNSRSQRVNYCFEGRGEKKCRLRRANSNFEVEGKNREERTRLRWKMGYKGVNIQGPSQFPLSRFEFESAKRDGKKRRLQQANSCFDGEGEKREEKKCRLQRIRSCLEGKGKKREEKNCRSQLVNYCFEGRGEKKSRLRRANSNFEVDGENRKERTSLRRKMGYKGVNIQGPSQFPLSRFEFEGGKRDGKKSRLQRANSCFEGEGEKREERREKRRRR